MAGLAEINQVHSPTAGADPAYGLSALSGCAGIDCDVEFARRCWLQSGRDVENGVDDPAMARLAAAARLTGLSARPAARTLDAMIELACPGFPVAVTAGPGAGRPVWVIEESRRGAAKARPFGEVEQARWLSSKELAKAIGLESSGEICRGAVFEPAAPLESLRSADAGHHSTGESPMERLWALARAEAADLWIILIYALAVGILLLATPLAVESLVNSIAFGGLQQQVLVVSLMLFACLGLAALLRGLQTWVMELIQRRVFVRLAVDLAHRLPRVDWSVYDHAHGPELVNRFFDVVTVQKAVSQLLLDGVALVLSTVIGLLVLSFYHPFLLGYDVMLLTLIAYVVLVLGRGGVATSIQESIAKYRVAGGLEELAAHPILFKQHRAAEFAAERIDGLSREYLAARAAHFRVLMRQIGFALALQAAAGTSLLGLGGWLVVAGQLTLGQLVAAELIVSAIVGSFAKMGKHFEAFYDLQAAMDKIGVLLDLPLEQGGGERVASPATPASVALRDVSFAYAEDRPILQGVQVAAAPGERIGVAGVSGSGKTTLLDLLFGLRHPTRGRVELDGVDLRSLDLDTLRRRVAMMRGPEVVEGTILDNVRLGRADASILDVRDALETVGLLEDVLSMSEGLHTRLSAGGQPLSEGQALRVALARAIVAEPRLLLLDQTFDSFDDESLRPILDRLFRPGAPWTLIVASSRPEVLRRCDRVVRLSPAQSANEQAASSPLRRMVSEGSDGRNAG